MTHWLPMVAAVAAALLAAVVLWPLRQQGRRSFVLGVVALGVAGACLYLLVGNPRAAQVQPAPSVATLRDGVEALQQALQRDPQRADGWALLGRSQLALGKLAEATAAKKDEQRYYQWREAHRKSWAGYWTTGYTYYWHWGPSGWYDR